MLLKMLKQKKLKNLLKKKLNFKNYKDIYNIIVYFF